MNDEVAGSLLGTLPGPGLNTTDSFLSLNTTTSDVSVNPTQSLGNLPQWHIPLSKLETLQSILAAKGWKHYRQIVSCIICVVGVESVKLVRRKEEREKGREGTLWMGKWDVIAPEGEVSCEVTLWEQCAADWGTDRIRKGDVVLLESALSST